jgi:hypothetical protein
MLQGEHPRARVDSGRLVCAVCDRAAVPHVLKDQLFGALRGRSIECGEGLIQQPKRHALRERQPREGRSPALPLGELPDGFLKRQAKTDQGVAHCLGRDRNTGERAADFQVFGGGELILKPRGMTDVDELARVLLGEAPDRLAAPAHFALRRGKEATEDAQQARLAAAVGAGDAQ